MHNSTGSRQSRFSSVRSGLAFPWRNKTKHQVCRPLSGLTADVERKGWIDSLEKTESAGDDESGSAAENSFSLDDEVKGLQANNVLGVSESSVDSYISDVWNSKSDAYSTETWESEQTERESEYGFKDDAKVEIGFQGSLANRELEETLRWNERVDATEKRNLAHKILDFSETSTSSSSSSLSESGNFRTGVVTGNDYFIKNFCDNLPSEVVEGQKEIENVVLCGHEELSVLLNELIAKMKHNGTEKRGDAVARLRSLTRNSPENRAIFCHADLLAVLVPLLDSPSSSIRINSVVSLLNLSLDKHNKIKITRAGAIPPLIKILRKGHPEEQENAAAAIFSLALNNDNKLALGALGAVPPLMNILKSSSSTSRGKKDAAMALYNLSLTPQLNQPRMVDAGLVPLLLGIAKEDNRELSTYAMRILSSLASSKDGRTELLKHNAINIFLRIIEQMQPTDSNQTEEFIEHIMATLLLLSKGNMRFKPLALQAGALDILMPHKERGTQRAQRKCLALLKILTEPILHMKKHSSDKAFDFSFDSSQYPRSYMPRQATNNLTYIPGNRESKDDPQKEKAQSSYF